MKLAFYAPLKSPDDPIPSGDRQVARSLLAALAFIGADVTLASTLRSRDGRGDPMFQDALFAQAEQEIARLITLGQCENWQAWLTYHNYYKAPDLIGPEVAGALGIPYLQVESTRARKRLSGPWNRFAEAAEKATDAANVVFYFTRHDEVALRRDAPNGQELIHLKPFLNLLKLPDASVCSGPILTVAMMRYGDKCASYQLIADALASLESDNWHLKIIGDGPAQEHVKEMFASLSGRVEFLGALDPVALHTHYQNASVLFWPGVNEAFGMTYLEAQAHGVPVIAQDRAGVRDVLSPGSYPDPDGGAEALANMLTHFLGNQEFLRFASVTARDHIRSHHLLPAASETLRNGLEMLGVHQ